jgi:hypothetical protein
MKQNTNKMQDKLEIDYKQNAIDLKQNINKLQDRSETKCKQNARQT